MDIYQNIKEGERGAWLSIIAYLSLSLLKIIIAVTYASEALLADGLNNATDIIASLAVLVGLKISRKPPDEDHRYGHFRAETVSALIASLIMMIVGIEVLWRAVRKFFDPVLDTPGGVAAWTALVSAAVMFAVYQYNRKLALRINSRAVMAAAYDNRSDALVSLGAFIGIVGAQTGLAWMDPLAATLVGAVICKTAWDIFRDASHTLTDGFDDKKLEQFRRTVEQTKGVASIKDIKARFHGNRVFVDMVIQVADNNMNVVESHRITEEIEKRMWNEHRISEVHIHIEPKEG